MPINGKYRNPGLLARFRWIGSLALCVLMAVATNSRAEEAANTIHFELLGNGLLYSINYDRLFSHNFAGRVGWMYFSGDATSDDPSDPKVTVTMNLVPITGSYLGGPGNHRLEVGGGPVLAFLSADVEDGVQGISASGLATIVTILGYRYQPMDGGFNFRIAFTPHIVINGDTPFLPWGGLSLGYTF